MIYERKHLSSLKPQELDGYLDRGWYRWAQTVFTGHILAFPDSLYPAAWIRLDLQDYRFRKSLRRILRRNGEVFEVRIQPAVITAEKNLLFKLYRAHFKGDLFPTLKDAILGGKARSVFNTREVGLYHDGKLVAFSFFDVGQETIASIMGVYHPDYSSYGLGFYTMLLEIEWAMEKGMKHYYPGYVVPGNSRFDYKLRIGDVEFFEPRSKAWLPWDQFDLRQSALAILRDKLSLLQVRLARKGRNWLIGHYANFEDPCEILKGLHTYELFRFPLYLAEDNHLENDHPLVVEYDLVDSVYRLSRFRTIKALPFPNHNKQLAVFSYAVNYDIADFVFLGSLLREEVLAENAELDPVLEALLAVPEA